MVEPPAIIEQVKSEIIKFGENMDIRRKFQAVRNSRIPLGYMEDS